LSLAIGRNGQNARLAAKLTGWKIDIISDSIKKGDDKKKEASEVDKISEEPNEDSAEKEETPKKTGAKAKTTKKTTKK